MKYRRKPVVIEAFQMTEENRKSNKDWPKWLHEAWNKGNLDIGSLNSVDCSDLTKKLWIFTLEGQMEISLNDYIIQGVENELYPCRSDIFAKTYEVVK